MWCMYLLGGNNPLSKRAVYILVCSRLLQNNQKFTARPDLRGLSGRQALAGGGKLRFAEGVVTWDQGPGLQGSRWLFLRESAGLQGAVQPDGLSGQVLPAADRMWK